MQYEIVSVGRLEGASTVNCQQASTVAENGMGERGSGMRQKSGGEGVRLIN